LVEPRNNIIMRPRVLSKKRLSNCVLVIFFSLEAHIVHGSVEFDQLVK
jgi:hypothetical protein